MILLGNSLVLCKLIYIQSSLACCSVKKLTLISARFSKIGCHKRYSLQLFEGLFQYTISIFIYIISTAINKSDLKTTQYIDTAGTESINNDITTGNLEVYLYEFVIQKRIVL